MLKNPDKSGIKLIDFGSSCFSDERVYTYIVSRFYRAPEIILGVPYTTAIDMWSFACIMCELYTGIPLFPGESEAEQISLIMETLGVPPRHLLFLSTRKKLFFDEDTYMPLPHTNSRGKTRMPGTKSLAASLRGVPETFLDFIKKCFEWDP